jgi:hypothetical protein
MNGTATVQRSYDYLGPVRVPPQNIQTSDDAQASGEMVTQNERGWSLPPVRWPRPKGFS